jgi:glycerophosphoryl diester phosphodiesterase
MGTRWPENTIAAFAAVLDEGADGFECDVVLTRDGEPVVVHVPFYSDDISVMVGSRAKVGGLDFSELRGLSIGGERIPHLEEVLALVRARSTACFIEPKRCGDGLVARIVREVEAQKVLDKVVLLTFVGRGSALLRARQLQPEVRTAVITTSVPGRWRRAAAATRADMVVASWKGVNHLRLLDGFVVNVRARVDRLRQDGIAVYGGLADRRTDVEWLCSLGVGGIFTNNVGSAKDAIRRWASKNVSQDFALQIDR